MPLILTRNAKALQEFAGLRVRNAVSRHLKYTALARIPEFPPTPASQFGLRHLGEGATFPAPARSSLIPLLSDNQAKCSKIAAKWQAESRMKFNTSQKSTGSPAIKPNVSSNAVTTRLPPN